MPRLIWPGHYFYRKTVFCEEDTKCFKDSCDHILAALHSLGQQFNLVLVDWNAEIIVRLTDVQAVKDYLSEEHGFEIN
jgi:hypothetical protein